MNSALSECNGERLYCKCMSCRIESSAPAMSLETNQAGDTVLPSGRGHLFQKEQISRRRMYTQD